MAEKKEVKCSYDYIEEEKKLPALGIRHLQIMMMCLVVTVLLIIRSSMGVAVLAMTEQKNNFKTNVTAAAAANYSYNNGSNTLTNASTIIEIDTFEWDKKIQGGILSAFFWGYMLNQLPGSVVAKRFGGKPVLLASLIINGVLCMAMPFLAKFGGWQTVCAVRWLMGLTQCVYPSCHTLLGMWIPPHERTLLSTITYTGVSLGPIISMSLGGLLAHTALGWKLIFYSMGGLAFATAILWAALAASSPAEHRLIGKAERKFIEDSLQSHEHTASIPWRMLATSVPLLVLAITQIGTTWTFTIFFVETPTYMNKVLGINLKDSGIISALPFVAMWLLSMFFGFICENLYNKGMLTLSASRKVFNSIGTFGPAIGLVVLSFLNSSHPYVAVGVLTLTVGVQSAIGSGFMMNHLDLSPTYAGVLQGITNGVSQLVAALAPIVDGFILGDHPNEVSRWRLVFFLAALVATLTNIVFLIWGTTERQPWDDPAFKQNKPEIEPSKSAPVLATEKVYVFQVRKEEHK